MVQSLSRAVPAERLVWPVEILEVLPVIKRRPATGNKKAARLIEPVMQQSENSFLLFSSSGASSHTT